MELTSELLIGKGKTAKVFLMNNGRVLKLFNKGFWEPAIESEYEAMKCINELGINAPQCYEKMSINDQIGITYEHVDGTSMLENISRNILKLNFYARRMAFEHFMIHQNHTDKLPNQIGRFEDQIKNTNELIGKYSDKLITKLKMIKSGNAVSHGDFHPDNILVENNNCIVIDWMNSYSGSPAGDVARTYLMLISPYIPDNIPRYLIFVLNIIKRNISKTYIDEYLRLSNIDKSEIINWIDIIAAARLIENIPNEKEWLINIVKGKNGLLRASPSNLSRTE